MQSEQEQGIFNAALRNSTGRHDPAIEHAQNLIAAQNMVGSMQSYYHPSNSYTPQVYTPQQVYPNQISSGQVYSEDYKPNINEENTLTNQQNLRQFYDEVEWNFDEETYVREELTKNSNLLQNVSGGVNYTEAMFSKQHYNGFVPFYITNVAESLQCLDLSFESSKIKSYRVPSGAFLSTTDYAQPVATESTDIKTIIPTVSIPKGNVHNCLMVNVKLYDIVNSTNYPVAIILGQREIDPLKGGQYFKPWGKRSYYVDQKLFPAGASYDLPDSRVHWIIPPKYTRFNDYITVYKSGYEVNLPLGARYPSVDGKFGTLVSTAQKVEENKRIIHYKATKEHPVVEWLFANKAYYPKLNLPARSSDANYYVIDKDTFEKGCELFLKDFNLSVPVVDLGNMEVHALILDSPQKTYSTELNSVKDLDKMIRNLQFGKDTAIGAKLKETPEFGSVFFRMGTDHIFRDEALPVFAEKKET